MSQKWFYGRKKLEKEKKFSWSYIAYTIKVNRAAPIA